MNIPKDETFYQGRTKSILAATETRVTQHDLSMIRTLYLRKTIELVQNHGAVYLVRFPVHSRMRELEESYMPDFDRTIEQLATECHVRYINLIDEIDRFNAVDGSHLWPEDGTKVTKQLIEIIHASPRNVSD